MARESSAATVPADLLACALAVLLEPDPSAKAEKTRHYATLWHQGKLQLVLTCEKPPDRPARRSDLVKLVQPREMPRLGKGGSLASRQALLHSLVHTESWAVDLAWDALARFGPDAQYQLPRAFFDDFVKVADDEARHFQLLHARLQELGSSYGSLPAHDGLWESAAKSSCSLPARLAVEHCVHEGRGLDVLPQTINRFRSNGDSDTAAILADVILPEEVQHCAAGVRWLRHLFSHAPWPPRQGDVQGACDQPARKQLIGGSASVAFCSVEGWFHHLVGQYFAGNLKPPFNEAARAAAGFTPEWYLPLAEAGGTSMLPDGSGSSS